MERYPDLPNTKEFTSDQIADAVIRAYCGWHVAPVVEDDLILDSDGGKRLVLPTLHLLEVLSLVVDGDVITDFTFSENGWLTLPNRTRFPKKDRCVEVKIKHGFSYVPELTNIRSKLVSRAMMSPAGTIVSQRAGTQSVTYAASGGEVAGMNLLDSEKEILEKYRLNWGA